MNRLMNEIVLCKNCNSSFRVTNDQQAFVIKSRMKGMSFIMLECPNCNSSTDFNPNEGTIKVEEEQLIWRTPISKINGFVSLITDEDEVFYGCGESGFIWRTKEKFYESIEEIIRKYPHREFCYRKQNGDWLPNEDEPINIDELIDSEEGGDIRGYEIE